MLVLMILFIILMIFWLIGGWAVRNPALPWGYAGGTIIPWICVAILGFILFGGPSAIQAPAPAPTTVR